jgi:hypothetical protein
MKRWVANTSLQEHQHKYLEACVDELRLVAGDANLGMSAVLRYALDFLRLNYGCSWIATLFHQRGESAKKRVGSEGVQGLPFGKQMYARRRIA